MTHKPVENMLEFYKALVSTGIPTCKIKLDMWCKILHKPVASRVAKQFKTRYIRDFW